jgi:hypothetical protein
MPHSQIKSYPDWGLALGFLIAKKFFDGPRCNLPSMFSRDELPQGLMFFADILLRLQTQWELATRDELFTGIALTYTPPPPSGSTPQASATVKPPRISEFLDRKWFASALMQESDYRLAITRAIDAVVLGPVESRQAAYAFSSGTLNELIAKMQSEVARDLFWLASDFSNGAFLDIDGSLSVLTRITETVDAEPTETLSEEQKRAVKSALNSIRDATENLGAAVSIHALSFPGISSKLLEFIDDTRESLQADFGMKTVCALVDDLTRAFQTVRKSVQDNRDKLLAAHLPEKYQTIVSSGLLENLCHSVGDIGETSRLSFGNLSRTQQADCISWAMEIVSLTGEDLSSAVKKFRNDFDEAEAAFECRFGCRPVSYTIHYRGD